MQELIAAAKVVCDLFDYTGTVEECEAVNRLSDAVDRAEKQEAVGFDEYMKTTFGFTGRDGQIYSMPTYKKLWIAAQQAERERIRARAKIAAEKAYLIEKFVDALLEVDDAPAE